MSIHLSLICLFTFSSVAPADEGFDAGLRVGMTLEQVHLNMESDNGYAMIGSPRFVIAPFHTIQEPQSVFQLCFRRDKDWVMRLDSWWLVERRTEIVKIDKD